MHERTWAGNELIFILGNFETRSILYLVQKLVRGNSLVQGYMTADSIVSYLAFLQEALLRSWTWAHFDQWIPRAYLQRDKQLVEGPKT